MPPGPPDKNIPVRGASEVGLDLKEPLTLAIGGAPSKI